jgi:hypothetical protein
LQQREHSNKKKKKKGMCRVTDEMQKNLENLEKLQKHINHLSPAVQGGVKFVDANCDICRKAGNHPTVRSKDKPTSLVETREKFQAEFPEDVQFLQNAHLWATFMRHATGQPADVLLGDASSVPRIYSLPIATIISPLVWKASLELLNRSPEGREELTRRCNLNEPLYSQTQKVFLQSMLATKVAK